MEFTKDYLVDIHNRNYPEDEFIQVARYLHHKTDLVNLDGYTVFSIVGTGGSRKPKPNLSTMLAKKLSNEFTIAKNGNNATTGSAGGFNILRELNYKICNTPQDVLDEIKSNNLAYLFQRSFNPIYAEVAPIRSEIPHATLFNYLGPVLNPVNNLKGLVMGCTASNMMEKIAIVANALGINILLVYDEDTGIDEVSISGKTKVFEMINGVTKEYYIVPEDLGFKRHADIMEYFPKNIDQAKEIFNRLLNNTLPQQLQDYFDINYKAAKQFYLRCV